MNAIEKACLTYVAETVKSDPRVGRVTVITLNKMAKEVAEETDTAEGYVGDIICALIRNRQISWRLFRYTSEIHSLARELRRQSSS